MWHTARFCNSHAYISFVQGFVNDSASTAMTPSRSSSPSSGSIQYGGLSGRSCIPAEFRVCPPHVVRPYCVRRRALASSGRVSRECGDRAGEQRRGRLRKGGVIAHDSLDDGTIGHGTVADELRRRATKSFEYIFWTR